MSGLSEDILLNDSQGSTSGDSITIKVQTSSKQMMYSLAKVKKGELFLVKIIYFL